MLRGTDFLVDFLREPNQDTFQIKVVNISADLGPKNIYDFKTLTGQIDVYAHKRAKIFCDNLPEFTGTQREITK